MLDLHQLRHHPHLLKQSLAARQMNFDVDAFWELDENRRELQIQLDQWSQEKNRIKREENLRDRAVSKRYSQVRKKIKQGKKQLARWKDEWEKVRLKMPNFLHPASDLVPPERKEVVREHLPQRKRNFKPLSHIALVEKNEIVDFDRGTQLAGPQFVHYPRRGAELNRALINYMIDFHRDEGYTEVSPPYLASAASVVASGHLPKFASEMYSTEGGKLYLVPTGEVPLLNLHRREILAVDSLPVKYQAYTPCFRREVGGSNEGLLRIHQFDKVELFAFAPRADSDEVFHQMVNQVEKVVLSLGLPYRIVRLHPPDMSQVAACTWDLEVWCPVSERFLEVSSISHCLDFQSRRGEIRFRPEGKLEYVHTLNASGVALPRLVAAMVEWYQRKDGKIEVAEALQDYLGRKIL